MTRLSDEQQEAIAPLVRTLHMHELVCIGASAVGHHIPLDRLTNDVDFALKVSPDEVVGLVTPLGFEAVGSMTHRFRARNGVLVDVVPYDEASLARRFVEFASGSRMSVVGFDLLAPYAQLVPLDREGVTLRIADLAVLVVLKIVAYLDRPLERERDLDDLHRVFENVLAPDDERRWGEELLDSRIEHEHQGAYFIGRRVGEIASAEHLARIDDFLGLVRKPNGIHFGRMLRNLSLGGNRVRRLGDRLDAFRSGVCDA